MKRLHSKYRSRVTLALLFVLAAIPCVLTWLAWKQGERNHALLAAIDRNDTAAAVRLLEEGAYANAREETPQQRSFWHSLLLALHLRKSSVPQGSPALLRLLEPLPPSAQSDSCFHFRPENEALAAALLDHGAEVESRCRSSDHYDNALQWAACSGKTATIRLLLKHGANINSRNNYGSTPLMEAAWNGEEKSVQILVELGADANIRDSFGVSPLREAETYEMKGIARILRKAGAKR